MARRVAVWVLALALVGLVGCLGPRNTPPVAAFSFRPSGGEARLRVRFDASLSSDPDGQIASRQWDFGDGETGEGRQVEHVYWDEGSYPVTLTVTDEAGGSASTVGVVEVGRSYPLDVLSWELEDHYFGSKVEGQVENVGQRTIAQGRIAVRFYAPGGAFHGERSAYVFDLAPGGQQDFTVTTSLVLSDIGHIEIYTEAVLESEWEG
ncbi:MAG: PKD domain-containing protein [Candidatus Bipolaricaulaceae bacterium]